MFLNKEAYDNSGFYNDIHIIPTDCGDFVVEWVQRPWDDTFGGHFEFLEEDEEVYKQVRLPNNEYIWVPKRQSEHEVIREWLKDNPGYELNEYGVWVEKDTQRPSTDNGESD